jgi:hypothetical protein
MTHYKPRRGHTAYGISNCKSQIPKLKSEIWNNLESEIPSEARSWHRPIARDRRGSLLGHAVVNKPG